MMKLRRIPVLLVALLGTSLSVVAKDSHPIMYKGVYTVGFEVNAFTPCNDTKDYWLYSENDALADIDANLLDQIANGKGDEPYLSVYLEFDGVNEGKSDGDGFDSEYDGVINASKVRLSSKVIPNNCKIHSH
ncbi:hypothetical protein [Photobacterium damselae]|uniref:hypothetical protein n=1 Tax=Photobacterium damselae TaxID=38293 RepID=UPI001EFCB76B|nr:hypothetical protein [Photobacterium damselae]MCG9777643.1 hypothetical protein [Photobacterium damselae]